MDMDFKAYDPHHPTTQFSEFRKAVLRRIAGGLNLSYNTLGNDLEGVNFSSLRDGKLTERDGYKCLQSWFIDTYRRPLFLAWLKWSLDMGLLKMNNGLGSVLPAAKFDKFAEHRFVPRRWQWVDPLKDAKMNLIMRENNWMSDEQIVSEMGGDYRETILQTKGDEEFAAAQGVETRADKDAAELDSMISADTTE
jgi:lambda family phage portal protein